MTTSDGVEPGYTTTEFWVTAITGIVAAFMDAYVAFGGAIDPQQRGMVITIITATIPLLAAAYAVARSLRKKGVTALPSQTSSQPSS